ncbi:MAG TPA: family 1 glycosylhydrolase, partial [Candidatus Paceibacterota bacterium]|nr:family 1 glycosylhydrolase [Candidatus Paceibacterota bacterium]
ARVVFYLKSPEKLREALKGAGFDRIQTEGLIENGLVRYFMPFNEPGVTFGNSYLGGNFPPFKKGRVDLVYKTLGRMVDVHEIMTDTLRTLGVKYPNYVPKIGMGYNWQYFEGWGSSLLHAIDHFYTRRFENRVQSDFIGLHYYCRLSTHLFGPSQKEREMSEHPLFGDVYPKGIFQLLTTMHRLYPDKPIMVSEIGFSEEADWRRPFWILETVQYILEAKRKGIPVEAVLLWSLVNNLEWDLGLSQRFGLFWEAQLKSPLFERKYLSSWQVWSAVAQALLNPSPQIEKEMQTLLERARKQYGSIRT